MGFHDSHLLNEATEAKIRDADFEGIRFRGHLDNGKLVVEGVLADQATLDGIPVTSAFTFSAVAGQPRVIEAVSPQGSGGRNYTFASWSDGGAQRHTITVPTTAVTLTAKFQKR